MPTLTENELLDALSWIAVAVLIVGAAVVWAWAEVVIDGATSDSGDWR